MATLGTFSGGGLGFGVRFSLYDAFSGVATKIRSSFSSLQSSVDNFAQKATSNFRSVATGLTMVFTGLRALQPITRSIDEAATFEKYRVSMETFLGTADQARAALRQIQEDALDNPIFGMKEMAQANLMVMSQYKGAEESMSFVRNLTTALAAVGRGNEELVRLGKNMQQIAARGATARDLNEFGTAGINILQLLKDANIEYGSSTEITFEMIAKALEHATSEGGKFHGAMERMAATVDGMKARNIENINFMRMAIGQAIEPLTKIVYRILNVIFEGLRAFADTTLGKWVIRLGVIAFALTVIGVILLGITMTVMALGPAIWAAFLPLLKIGIILALILAPIIATAAILIYSWREFNKVLNGTAKPANGLLGVFQRIGALLYAAVQIFKSLNSESFELSEGLVKTLDDMGMLDSVIALGMWMGRIREFAVGMWDGMKAGWAVVKPVLKDLYENYLEPIFDWFSEKILGGIMKAETSMEKWRKAGVIAGIAIIALLLTITTLFVILGVTMFLAMLPMLIMLTVFLLQLYAIYKVGMILFKWAISFKLVMLNMWISIQEAGERFVLWMAGLVMRFLDIGRNMVDKLKEGMGERWASLVTWIANKLNELPLIGKFLGYVLGADTDGDMAATGPQSPSGAPSGMDDYYASMNQARGAMLMAPVYNSYQQGGLSQLVNNVYLDGELIYNGLVDRERINEARS